MRSFTSETPIWEERERDKIKTKFNNNNNKVTLREEEEIKEKQQRYKNNFTHPLSLSHSLHFFQYRYIKITQL